MKILFDLDVLVDVVSRWTQFPESLALFEQIVGSAKHEGAFPGCGYTTLYYVLCKALTIEEALAAVSLLRERLEMLPFDERTAQVAHGLKMKDLVDACVAATAVQKTCQVIATRNVADYARSPIPAKSPADLLRIVRA